MFKFLKDRIEQKNKLNGGYSTFKIFLFSWIDMWIIYYPTYSFNRPHVDPIQNRKHYRINFILTPCHGGKFYCEKMIINLPFLKIFRSDLYKHEVKPVTKGTRIVLSIGYAPLRNAQFTSSQGAS